MTARLPDSNGWYEIKGNPLSKTGIFPYLGASMGAPDPHKVYRVLRPASELADPACIASFRLLPWVDDHAMLGDPAADPSLIPAECKGVQGVIGEDVFFDEGTGTLRANIKVWSEHLADLIDGGKRQLSCGYRCDWEFTPGQFAGQPYDAIQRNIRGNHLALVAEGRMGPEVAVLDHLTFSLDMKDAIPMAEDPEESGDGAQAMTLAQLTALVTEIVPQLRNLAETVASLQDAQAGGGREGAGQEAGGALDRAMLTKSVIADISARDALARQLAPHIGVFDCAGQSLAEVAAYGLGKLGLTVAAGQEMAALTGYLAARTIPSPAVALDGKSGGTASAIDSYLKGARP